MIVHTCLSSVGVHMRTETAWSVEPFIADVAWVIWFFGAPHFLFRQWGSGYVGMARLLGSFRAQEEVHGVF